MKNELNKEHTAALTATTNLKEPALYRVVVHNDDFTPMEFVMMVLEKFFFMSRDHASKIMLEAHTKGKAVFGNYTKDFAETKILQVIDYARSEEQPLIFSTEAV